MELERAARQTEMHSHNSHSHNPNHIQNQGYNSPNHPNNHNGHNDHSHTPKALQQQKFKMLSLSSSEWNDDGWNGIPADLLLGKCYGENIPRN